MCGWPFALEGGLRPISPPRPGSGVERRRADYRAEFVVPRARPIADSKTCSGRALRLQRGTQPFRLEHAVRPPAASRRPALSPLVGPFVTHQRTIRAVARARPTWPPSTAGARPPAPARPCLAACVRVVATTAEPDPAAGRRRARTRRRAAVADRAPRPPRSPCPACWRRSALRRFVAVSASDYTRTLQPGADQAA